MGVAAKSFGFRQGHLSRSLAWPALLISPAAFGAHPLITEDAGVQGRGKWQFELNTDHAVERGSRLAGHAVNAALTYGLSESVDLSANLPWQHDEVNDNPREVAEGVGDTTLNLKWRYYERDTLALALKPILSQPSGDSGNGLGSGRVSAALVGIATWSVDSLSVSGNLGYAYNNNDAGDRKDIWSLSGAVLYGLTDKLQVAFEMGGYSNSDPNAAKYPVFANIGLIYSPTPNLDWDIGYLRGLNDAEALYSLGVGMTWRW